MKSNDVSLLLAQRLAQSDNMKEMATMAPVRRSSQWPTAVLNNPPQRQNRIWMITIPYHSGMINLMAILASLVMFTISQNHFYALAVGVAGLCDRPSVCMYVCHKMMRNS